MYILYGNVAGWKELHRSHEEMDIVYEMGKYIDGHTPINFIIKETLEKGDRVYKTITTNNQYITYSKQVTENYMMLKQAQGKVKKLTKKK